MNSQLDKYDLVIIGGGPAGMSAALIAGRTLLNTVIINAENPRNRVTKASHGFLSRDGIHPLELFSIAKQQLEKYKTVDYVKGNVIDVTPIEQEYSVKLQDGTNFRTGNIIFASGTKEDISKIGLSGIEKVYGQSVFPCPFCDGWEHKGEKLAVFGRESMTAEFAKIISNWSKDIIVFTNGNQVISDENKTILDKGGISVIEEEISELISDEHGKLQAVQLKNGNAVEREAGFLTETHEEAASNLPLKLGVQLTTNSWGMEILDADEVGKTNVPGVFIVGDAKSGFGGLLAAARDGAACVETLLHERVHHRWAAVATG